MAAAVAATGTMAGSTVSCGDPAYAPKAAGAFQRGASNIQHWIDPHGSEFPPEPGRYHIFVNYSCGWSHRVMLVRSLKGLEDCISLSHVGNYFVYQKGSGRYRGWPVPQDPTGSGFQTSYDIYNSENPGYGDGSESHGKRQLGVPILFDKQLKKVVSNDSAQILIMLNGAFESLARHCVDLHPSDLHEDIEAVNTVVYPGINDGVYRCRFAKTDEAYHEAYTALVNALQFVEQRLVAAKDSEGGAMFLCGGRLTLADLRAFPHLYRFEMIYRHFMLRQDDAAHPVLTLNDYPRIAEYVLSLFSQSSIATTCDLQIALRGYGNQIAKIDVGACDAMYERQRSAPWPTTANYEAKREAEGLSAQFTAMGPRDIECP